MPWRNHAYKADYHHSRHPGAQRPWINYGELGRAGGRRADGERDREPQHLLSRLKQPRSSVGLPPINFDPRQADGVYC